MVDFEDLDTVEVVKSPSEKIVISLTKVIPDEGEERLFYQIRTVGWNTRSVSLGSREVAKEVAQKLLEMIESNGG